MEFRTERLTPAQMEQEAGQIVDFLKSHGGFDLTVYLGWNCDVEEDDRYREISLPLEGLLDFISQNVRTGSFGFGDGDLSIMSKDAGVTFLLCHESDIHVTTNTREMAQEIVSIWTRRGHTFTEISVKP